MEKQTNFEGQMFTTFKQRAEAYPNKILLVDDYINALSFASRSEGASRDATRDKYGLYTYREWLNAFPALAEQQ